MKPMIFVAAIGLILAGCAGPNSADCKVTDWYPIGERDGRMGAQPQSDFYAARCGVTPDSKRYMEGWEAGFAARPIPKW